MENETYLCDKCNGKGNIPTKNPDVVKVCPKCHGKKELDWIENVVGVTKIKSFTDIQQEIIEQMGDDMVKKVDEEMMKMYTKTKGPSSQNINITTILKVLKEIEILK